MNRCLSESPPCTNSEQGPKVSENWESKDHSIAGFSEVLEPGWNTIRILGICSGMGPVLSNPWGICIDADGDVLVADWGKQHCIVLYPPVGVGRSIVSQGLSSPRGLAVLPDGHLVVSDSMNHCIKIYHYK
uniref:Uncharacterized protein n=1 Tax=Cyprinus carpio TaxID=7962 RepID=A0A8C1HF42_CYPCA